MISCYAWDMTCMHLFVSVPVVGYMIMLVPGTV
jgi:hypothetical protein